MKEKYFYVIRKYIKIILLVIVSIYLGYILPNAYLGVAKGVIIGNLDLTYKYSLNLKYFYIIFLVLDTYIEEEFSIITFGNIIGTLYFFSTGIKILTLIILIALLIYSLIIKSWKIIVSREQKLKKTVPFFLYIDYSILDLLK